MNMRALRDWRIWWVVIWMIAWVAGAFNAAAQVLPDQPPLAWDAPALLENWKIISAFLLPLAMGFIIQSNWGRGFQALATFAVSLVWTVIKYAIEGGFAGVTAENVIPSAMTIFALTIPFYYGLWKPTGVPQAIEEATNVTDAGKRAAALKYAA